MKKEIIIRKSSSICKELTKKTINGDVDWVCYGEFLDYLEISGLSINCVCWFDSYLKYLQMVRHIPMLDKSYLVFYQERVFAISQSKYSGDIRLDFASDVYENKVWHEIIAPQEQLVKLLSFIEAMDFDNLDENCRDLLYSTGCIHA